MPDCATASKQIISGLDIRKRDEYTDRRQKFFVFIHNSEPAVRGGCWNPSRACSHYFIADKLGIINSNKNCFRCFISRLSALYPHGDGNSLLLWYSVIVQGHSRLIIIVGVSQD